jgi:hypothetical protein
MYALMLAKIAELNHVADVNHVPEGSTLLVPNIPEVGHKYFHLPKIWTGQNIRTALTWVDNAVTDTTISKVAPRGAAPQEEIQYFVVPLREAENYKLPDNKKQGASGPITIRLNAHPIGNSSPQVLTNESASLIKSKLAAATNSPRPVLVIVDDSVPDEKEFNRSKNFVLTLSKTIRDTYRLGDSPYFSQLSNEVLVEHQDALFPNLRTHAAVIKQSLVEFTSLDPQERVTVIYIPMAATQTGTASIIRELLYLAQLLKIVQPPLPASTTSDEPQRTQAKQVTEDISNRNKSAFFGGSLASLGAGELTVTSDPLLLEAIGIVMGYYSNAVKRPYWLSFSWTASPFTYATYFDPISYGMKFTAAGNREPPPASDDFLRRKLEYASRAANSDDFVVVMNSNSATAGCASNIFDDHGPAIATVAFPGSVTGNYCGTSFSTPRAAWLAAAREAALGRLLSKSSDETAIRTWLVNQHKAILGLRKFVARDIFDRYLLDVPSYFGKYDQEEP